MPSTLNSTLRYSGTSDVVTYTSSSVQSAAFGAQTHEIRVVCTSNAWINIGENPTASAGDGSIFMPAGLVEYFHVSPGQKVAVIQDSSGGNLVVAEMTR
jgi:hypothetical protein